MAEHRSRAGRVFRRALVGTGLGLVGTLVALLAIELGVRAVGVLPPRIEREGEIFGKSPVPRLPYIHAPRRSMTLTTLDGRGVVQSVVEMHVNADGFRGPRVPRRRPADALRIACVGDSFTYGYGVPEGESWPDHLRELLSELELPHPVEVLNCGVNGFHSADERRYLEHLVLPWDPQIVVWQYFVNDSSRRGLDEDLPPAQGDSLPPSRRPRLLPWIEPTGRLAGLRARSRLLDLLCDRAYRSHGLLAIALEAPYDDGHPALVRVRMSITSANRLVRERGGHMLVALYPHLVAVGEGLASDGPYAKVGAMLREKDVPLVDASPAFRGQPLAELRNSVLDYHGNGRANRIFATVVLDELRRRGWVGARVAER